MALTDCEDPKLPGSETPVGPAAGAGERILCTDNQAWSSEEIILASRAQYHVERAFKQMKNPHRVSSVLQRKAAHGGLKLTIEKLLAELSGVTQLVNLFAVPEKDTRGRYLSRIRALRTLTSAGQAMQDA